VNLGKSNAAWNLFWDRVLACCAFARWALEQRERLRGVRLQARLLADPKGNTDPDGGIVVVGARPRLSATERFRLIARVTEVADPRTVSWYRATGAGGGDLVAQGSGNAGTTVAMVAQNDSGVSGSHPLNAAITPDDDDAHVIELEQDWRAYFAGLFDGTDPEGEDAKSLDAITDVLDSAEDLGDQLVDRAVEMFQRLLVTDPANKNERPYGSKFLTEMFTSLLADVPVEDGSGAVTRRRAGALESLLRAMIDEATGSTQTIVGRVVAAAAAVAASDNDGQLTLASHTPEGHMPTGVVRLRVRDGLGTGFGGRETLEVEWTSDVDDRSRRYARVMTMGQSYKGEDGFGGANGVTPTRVITKTGDGTNVQLSNMAAADWTVTGCTERNTMAGDLTCKVVADGSNRIFEFYRSTNLVSGELVARSTPVAAGALFVATQRNVSGLEIRGRAGSAPTDGSTTVHLNFLRVTNDAGRPDEWTIAVTLTSEGVISRTLAALPLVDGATNGYRLNGVTAGSELITDDRVKANTFPDFQVEDI
jgi:hypothetical protein